MKDQKLDNGSKTYEQKYYPGGRIILIVGPKPNQISWRRFWLEFGIALGITGLIFWWVVL